MAKKLQYQATSKALFVPVVVATVYVGPFTSFSTPTPAKNRALQSQSVSFTPRPPAQPTTPFTKFSEPVKRRSQVNAAWNFSIPPAKTQTAVFTQFSQPQIARKPPASLQPQGLFETIPASPPFTGFATFSQPLKAKTTVQYGFQPFYFTPPPPDTHDGGVFVKKKWKKHGPDPIDIELEEKAKRRAAIELAVYGPKVTYEPQRSILEPVPPAPPPNVEELARVIMQAQEAERQAQRLALEQDDEDVIEMILRDL